MSIEVWLDNIPNRAAAEESAAWWNNHEQARMGSEYHYQVRAQSLSAYQVIRTRTNERTNRREP